MKSYIERIKEDMFEKDFWGLLKAEIMYSHKGKIGKQRNESLSHYFLKVTACEKLHQKNIEAIMEFPIIDLYTMHKNYSEGNWLDMKFNPTYYLDVGIGNMLIGVEI